MRRLSFLVYSQTPATLDLVSLQLTATERVKVSAKADSVERLETVLGDQRFDGIYLDMGSDADRILEIVETVTHPRPLILMGGATNDPGLLLRAMRIGAKDFALDHQLIDIDETLDRVAPTDLVRTRNAPVLAVMGSKGGVGATTVACELAVSLQEAGLRTLVCDLSSRIGDVSIYFDLSPTYTFADIARRDEGLDAVFVEAVVCEHSSHVSVLAAPTEIDDFGLLTSSKLDHALKLLRPEFDCIILDIPFEFDEFSLRALDMANEILIVTTADVAALTHTQIQRDAMERLGAAPERIHTVLNRVSNQSTLSIEQVETHLDMKLDAQIPDQPGPAREAADQGHILREVNGSEDLLRAIHELRDHVCEWFRFDVPRHGRRRRKSTGLVDRVRGMMKRKSGNGAA